jgi:hypothetical protein
MTTSLVTTGRKRRRDSNRSDSSNIIVNPLDVVEGSDLIAIAWRSALTSLHARASLRKQRILSIRRTRWGVGPGRCR